jgi:hypothetical protein
MHGLPRPLQRLLAAVLVIAASLSPAAGASAAKHKAAKPKLTVKMFNDR